jgi:hypothetical protein
MKRMAEKIFKKIFFTLSLAFNVLQCIHWNALKIMQGAFFKS